MDELTTSIYSDSYIHYNVLDTLGQPKLGVGVMTGEVTDQPTCLWCGLAVLCHFTGLLCEPGRHMYRYRHSLPTYCLPLPHAHCSQVLNVGVPELRV